MSLYFKFPSILYCTPTSLSLFSPFNPIPGQNICPSENEGRQDESIHHISGFLDVVYTVPDYTQQVAQ